jgi:hypothetical protein
MNLVERIKGILLTPRTEWPVIEREPGDPAYLYTNYVMILAAIPAIAGFIGASLVGISVGGLGTVRVGFFAGLLQAVLGYLLALVGVYVMALIIDALAPTFGGQKNFPNAMKVASYFPTPFWLAGIFSIIPRLAFLSILGLYGFYLLWIGLPALMKSPEQRALGYTAAVIVCAIVITIVLAMLLGAVFGRGAGLF